MADPDSFPEPSSHPSPESSAVPPPPPLGPPPGRFGGVTGAAAVRRLGPIARWLVIAQFAVAAVAVATLLVQLTLVGDAQDYLDQVITQAAFEDALGALSLLSVLAGAASIASLVLGVLWSQRIAQNLLASGRGPLTFKPGLVVLMWLVGLCVSNMVLLPVVREQWRASDPETTPGDPTWRRGAVTPLIYGWFAVNLVHFALVISNGVLLFGGTNTPDPTSGDDTADRYRDLAESFTSTGWLVITALVAAASAVVFAQVVRSLTARHLRAVPAA